MQFLRYIKLLLVGLVATVLVACAVPQHIASTGEQDFQRIGRFSVSSEDAMGKQNAVQGGFIWLDSNQNLSLDLSNPVGSVLARININRYGASLQQSDGTTLHAEHVDELIMQAVGSNIPVSNLRLWMQGIAGDSAAINQYDDNKNVLSFNQDGWKVDLSRYDDKGPKLLRMQRNNAGEKINVRLVIQ